MAAGDYYFDADNVAGGGGTVDFTPGASTKYLIKNLLGQRGTNNMFFGLVIGGIDVGLPGLDTQTTANSNNFVSTTLFIDSSVTFRRRNSAAGAQDMGLAGIQIA